MKVNKVLLLLVVVSALSACGKEKEVTGSVPKSTIKTEKTVLVLGEDLPEEERGVVREYFKDETVEEVDITRSDYKGYFNIEMSEVPSLISSVAVKLNEDGKLSAKVLTKDLVTEVTEAQYLNAAVTAGFEDADIRVVSTRPVTGQAALVGVFKAYETLGLEVNSEKLGVAREELRVVTEVGAELPLEDVDRVTEVVVSAKEEIAGGISNDESSDLDTVLNESLEKAGISLSDDAKAKLRGTLETFKSKLTKEDAKNFLEKAKDLGSSLKDVGTGIKENLEEKGILEKIGDWFSNLFN